VIIDGVKYKTTERARWNHDTGCYIAFVTDGDRERAVVKDQGVWRFRTPIERVKPLLDYQKQMAKEGKIWP
jgi:hypothetical protein